MLNENFLGEEDCRDELERVITSQTKHAKTSNNDKNIHQKDYENSGVEINNQEEVIEKENQWHSNHSQFYCAPLSPTANFNEDNYNTEKVTNVIDPTNTNEDYAQGSGLLMNWNFILETENNIVQN